MKEIKQIIEAYDKAQQLQQKVVLATVVHIEGSAYRAPGARMLITEEGRLTGAVSGGCLEGDVLRKAQQVMLQQQPALITYDTMDDEDAAGLGVGLGCNGIIRILLEPVLPDNTGNAIQLLRRALDKREPAVLVTFFATDDKKNPQQGTRLLVTKPGEYTLHTALPVAAERMAGDIQQVLAMQASTFVQYQPAGEGDTVFTALLECLLPVPLLVVAGAGNDVLPLVQLAALMGWELTLIDGRPAYASATRFPNCRLRVARPEKALEGIIIDEQTAVLLMSHNYFYDKAVLAQAVQRNAAYIGILGPQKKRERLLQELEEEGTPVPPEQQARIYGPTGLDIGAETAEEIALSIISEIKTVFSRKSGKPLREGGKRIHHRNTRIVTSLETYGVVVLAAGQSARLGTPKQQLLYKGDTLLRNAVRTAAALETAATVVVAGSEATGMQQQLKDLPAELVMNTEYATGMASSIVAGVNHMARQHPQVTHILVMLCDQPHLDTAHLRRLIYRQQQTAAPVTASYYAARKGVPALFAASVFPQLLALTGDTGAKHLIETLGNAVETVPFEAGATDIDNREAYWKLLQENAPANTRT